MGRHLHSPGSLPRKYLRGKALKDVGPNDHSAEVCSNTEPPVFMATPVWLDCDPGHDDAMAIIMAAHSPSIRLIGVSTVAGNQTVLKTTVNAAKILTVAGVSAGDVPLVMGQSEPLIRAPRHDPGIHGESGMEGSAMLDRFKPSSEFWVPGSVAARDQNSIKSGRNWASEVASRIASCDEKVVIVATGALTNVAMLLSLYPSLSSKIKRIALMGGAIGIGNRSAVAEFNILCDPEAARRVFSSGIEVIMVPLEVTHTALADENIVKDILSLRTPFAQMVVDLLHFFKDTYKRVFGFGSPPVHDPCAVAAVIAPDIFTLKSMRVEVVVGDHTCAGQTVCDVWGDFLKPNSPTIKVATRMDVAAFWQLMLGAVRRCDAVTPFNAFARAQYGPQRSTLRSKL